VRVAAAAATVKATTTAKGALTELAAAAACASVRSNKVASARSVVKKFATTPQVLQHPKRVFKNSVHVRKILFQE